MTLNTTFSAFYKYIFLLFFIVATVMSSHAANLSNNIVYATNDAESTMTTHNDSAANAMKHLGMSVYGNPGILMATNAEQKMYMKSKMSVSMNAEILHSALPSDSSAFDEDYNYPTIGFGVKVALNHAIKLHKPQSEAFGMAEEVDYKTKLGNTVSFYGTFARPFLKTKRWQADYTMNVGIAYSHRKYNNVNAIDNELIGARWLIFFGAGLHATWHFHPEWGLKFGLDYWHLSNGAMSRPNKGANIIGPSLGFIYTPYYRETIKPINRKPEDNKYVYVEVTGGIGVKSLYEDWARTQFDTPKDDPEYRKDQFATYATMSLQADLMCRYARRWASGAGVDVFYGTYYKRLRTIDEIYGHNAGHSPISVGIAAKHEIFYHNFSFAVAVGYYIYREMGHKAYLNDAPYYERVGLHYTIPKLANLKLGINIKAHKGKADFTEIVFGMPIKIKRL